MPLVKLKGLHTCTRTIWKQSQGICQFISRLEARVIPQISQKGDSDKDLQRLLWHFGNSFVHSKLKGKVYVWWSLFKKIAIAVYYRSTAVFNSIKQFVTYFNNLVWKKIWVLMHQYLNMRSDSVSNASQFLYHYLELIFLLRHNRSGFMAISHSDASSPFEMKISQVSYMYTVFFTLD